VTLTPHPDQSEAAPERPIASAAPACEIPEVVGGGRAEGGALDRKPALFPGLCGARLREGGSCMELPAAGRSRCRVHGGATPVGPRSPHFSSGRFSRYPVPVLEDERERFERYRAEPLGGALAEHLALAMVQHDRAVASGRSGAEEGRTVATLARAYAQISLAQKKVVHVPDEAAARMLLGAIYGCVKSAAHDELGGEPDRERRLLEGIARYVLAVDWSKVVIQPATAAASPPRTKRSSRRR
jgi:hypothetical protein